MTNILANNILKNGLLDNVKDKEFREIWEWHSLEELEHSHVFKEIEGKLKKTSLLFKIKYFLRLTLIVMLIIPGIGIYLSKGLGLSNLDIIKKLLRTVLFRRNLLFVLSVPLRAIFLKNAIV